MSRHICFLLLAVFATGARAGVPPAPRLLSPVNGATVTLPFVESWTAVTDPSGIVAYNWQISPTPDFSNIISNGSTSALTQATISGLANGSYFFRVQAASGSFDQSPWPAGRAFTVSGSPGTLPAPVLQPTKAYSTFHPYEKETFNWSPVTGAATYTLQFSLDASFPVVHTGVSDNITDTTTGFAIANPEGNYFARVFAINAQGVKSPPSNVIAFSVFFTNPIGPPPDNLSPLAAGSLTLPIIIMWDDVPNPQPNGYEYEIATDPQFKNIEIDYPQLNENFFNLLTLTPGTKYWRVRSTQGSSSPLLPALTAWSMPGKFTVSTAPPTPVSITLARPILYSGDETEVQVQLTSAAPAAGATMSVVSSNPAVFPAPSSLTMPGNLGWTQFDVQTAQVTTPTPITLTVTVNGKTSSIQFIVNPPSLREFQFSPATVIGGYGSGVFVMLNGEAPPPAGALISISSSSPVVTVPATITAQPGFYWASFAANTTAVSVSTPVMLTARWNGSVITGQLTILPPPPPTSLTLNPTSIAGGSGVSNATATTASPVLTDTALSIKVSNPSLVSAPAAVSILAGETWGYFSLTANPVTVATPVTISVSAGGKTVSSVLTITPAAQVPLSGLSLAPSAVNGSTTATGTITLASAAPTTGTVVTLTSSNSAVAAVPASINIAAGATSGTFSIAANSVTSAFAVTITASSGGVARSAVLTVNPAPVTAVLTVTAAGRTGETVISSPAGISAPSGGSSHASFHVNSTVSLSVTNGRDATWSGACSSNGKKQKSCSLTLTADATVTAAIQ